MNLRELTPDSCLLFSTRIARLFAYGFLSVVLVLYLAQVGLSEVQAAFMQPSRQKKLAPLYL